MKITEAGWVALSPHVNTHRGGAPRPVFLALAALVPLDEITASWVKYDVSDGHKTVWSVWVATPTLLGYVQLTFDYPYYDSAEEGDRSGVTTIVNAAWTRRLASINAFSLSAMTPLVSARDEGHWYGFFGAVTFADGTQAALPEPPASHEWQDQLRWDAFIAAIRSAIR